MNITTLVQNDRNKNKNAMPGREKGLWEKNLF